MATFKVKAVFDYASGHEDDLPFSIGQIITVTDQDDADWYGGEYVDDAGVKQEGIFPRNFVQKYEPTAPPRPTRTKTKRDSIASPEVAAAPVFPPASPPQPAPEPEDAPASPRAPSPTQTTSAAPAAPAPLPEPPAPKPAAPAQAPAQPQPVPRPAEASPVVSPQLAIATPSSPKPAGPPPVSEKPNAFRDRIAAFNKAAAPPIAPFKPGGLGSGGFIKKPFQAQTARVYRRDEDPEIREQEAAAAENAGKAGLLPGAEGDEDEPKPLSLKERMALLQKQQMETAARHADAVAKKDKPKRPPKKRADSQEPVADEGERPAPPPPPERRDTEELVVRRSTDEAHPPRLPHPPRRKSSKGFEPRDGNEADMSGAGETTEGQDDEMTEKEDSDERTKHVATAAKQDQDEPAEDEDDEDEEDEEEDDVDPEVRRKEELRARMAKMSGGMGMPGMPGIPLFGGPPPALPKKKKTSVPKPTEDVKEPLSPRAPPVPVMALPGMSRPAPEEQDDAESEDDEARLRTPHQETSPALPSREPAPAPPVPAGRPAPPPVPTTETRPPPPPPTASAIKSQSEGSVSDDELSERPYEDDTPRIESVQARAPPPPPIAMPPVASPTSLTSPTSATRPSFGDDAPMSPGKRASRMPPPVPGAPPALPPAQTRPPPPPPTAPKARSDDAEEEITEYEGDYDTDIASSAPHKDALKSHQRESSAEDVVSPRSPTTEAPPIPFAAPPRPGPPPVPTQAPPTPADTRKSVDFPRVAPPPPPPAKEATPFDEDYDPFNYGAPVPTIPSYASPPPPPGRKSEEAPFFPAPQNPRSAPPAPPPGPPRAPPKQSLDAQRGRRSVDVARPSMESGYVANEIDLAAQSGWWLQPNSLPPQLQGRKDIFFESEESSAADSRRNKTLVTRDIYVLYQDYSQTVITVRFDPQDAADVHLEQRHEGPPRALRQDQLEQSYERFGRAIGTAVTTKKDTVVGDGTPQALVYELLRPFKDALLPVGTRAYGALVYSNLANASTTQNDEIRPGDIISIRNAKFQGKHGAMHAKYSTEVGKPDHVAVVAEWDGTKKKVRAWEQGRESKKVKMESFKLDDLRSGEVKIWRVMPRSWIGWEGGN
ncbi:hypothetical protein B0T18DRAFT_490252 [Schizothecium vesticola]|uniref:SH3 domain-containing protein n=1 Tax=Schizothecium vesticola TaxID=314040 RepID=A0AA40EQB6_9PEZI|nr:hypothetical protein B0T18DRAFT_490252 [Schizothecium vesticola]